MSGAVRRSRVLVRSEHPRGSYAAGRLRALAGRFLAALDRDEELSILVTTDARIRTINRAWRDLDRPTDVLSFPAPEGKLLGDIVVSLDTARQQAHDREKPLSEELARLLAHGLLHLLGHDHVEPRDAHRMALAEMELLGTVGLVGDALELEKRVAARRHRRQRTENLHTVRRQALKGRPTAPALETFT